MKFSPFFNIIVLLFFLLIGTSFNKPTDDLLRFNISMKVKNITTYSELEVKLKFQSLKKNGVIIPKIFFFGYENDEEADIVFELYKYNKSFSKKQIPTANYNYLYEKEYVTLPYLKTKIVEYDLFLKYSNFKNGNYRVRAKFIIPPNNLYPKKYIYSNWIYFTVKNMKYPSSPIQVD